MCGIKCRGEQASVDGGCEQLLEGARGGQVQRGEQVGVGESGVRVGEGEQGQQEEFLVLLGGELGQLGAGWVRLLVDYYCCCCCCCCCYRLDRL